VISRSTVTAFFISVIACFLLASTFNTQFVIAGLNSVQVAVPVSDRLLMTVNDWAGLAPTYGVLIMVGLLVAYSVMRLVEKRLGHAQILYPFGGALCFYVMIAAMEPVLGVTLVTGARSCLGLAFQCLAGAIGGWVFARHVVRG